jgi:hypothetical protein
MIHRSITTRFLLDRNREQSLEFIKPENKLLRQYYREKYPTEICAYKCMDGRLSLPVITKVPQGIIQPYRQMGGIFDLGDPYLGNLIERWVNYSVSKTRKCLVLSTYHFSKGDHKRGCAGHGEDTKEALKWAKKLVNQHCVVFGELSENSIVYPIVVGIETDSDGLVFHGDFGKTFSVFEKLDLSVKEIRARIAELYPKMPRDIREDLMMLVLGNLEHVKSLKKNHKHAADLVHKESVICVGRGFSWLHEPNKALIIGPYSNPVFSIEKAIETAGKIVLKNIKEGRVSETDGVTVMCSSLFMEEGMNRMRETIKAYSLYCMAKKVLLEKVPELSKYNLEFLVGSTSREDLLFREINPSDFEKIFEENTKLSDEESEAIRSLQ